MDKSLVEKTFLDGREKESFNTDIFTYLRENRKRWTYKESLPFDFQLGYIGYLGYELKKDTEKVTNKNSYDYPDAYFKYCDRALVYDHKDEKLYILSCQEDKDWIKEIKNILEENFEEKNKATSKKDFPKLKFVKDKKTYIEDIKKS